MLLNVLGTWMYVRMASPCCTVVKDPKPAIFPASENSRMRSTR
jgi:hypothetical protein